MKKIVVLTERLPYPPTSGTKNLLYNYCKILHEKLGFEVINISFLEQEDDVLLKPEFIRKTYSLPNPSNKAKISNLIIKTFLMRKYPMQVSLFWDKKIKNQIDNIVTLENPDFVVADFVRTTEYLKDFSGYKIADLQDLLSLRYKRQLDLDLATINPYGAYFYRLPNFLKAIFQIEFLKRKVLENEVKLLENFERDVGKYYDRVMFVAQSEGEIFDQSICKIKSLIVPLGVNLDFFSKARVLEKKDKTITFLGALGVAHNETGVIHFINYILPYIVDEIPDVKFYVIGGGATSKLKLLASENVIFTGRVDDVREYVGKSKVFVCPLTFGSGIKTKNLEAMAMGIPIVTTSIGAENIHAIDGEDWLIADDDKIFAEKVMKIMGNPELSDKLQSNAYHFVSNNFTWKVAEDKLASVFK